MLFGWKFLLTYLWYVSLLRSAMSVGHGVGG